MRKEKNITILLALASDGANGTGTMRVSAFLISNVFVCVEIMLTPNLNCFLPRSHYEYVETKVDLKSVNDCIGVSISKIVIVRVSENYNCCQNSVFTAQYSF